MKNKASLYQEVNLKTQIEEADDFTLVLMLMDGIIQKVSYAKYAIENNELDKKSLYISKALLIIEHLQNTLNKDESPVIAKTLFDLYSYMYQNLVKGSNELSCELLDEVLKVFIPVRDAWENMPKEEVQKAQVILSKKRESNKESKLIQSN